MKEAKVDMLRRITGKLTEMFTENQLKIEKNEESSNK